MISVTCPLCKKVYKVDEAALGKRVKCKDCEATFELTAGPQPAARGGTQTAAAALEQMAVAEPATAEPTGYNISEEGATGGGRTARATEPTLGGISGEPIELPRSVSPATPQRPFGLVWIVFYWAFAGLACLPLGYIILAAGGAAGGMAEEARSMFGSHSLGEPSGSVALRAALLEFLGLLVFHFGLLLLVASYGLWTFRKWGLALARGLAVAAVALNGIGLIIGIIYRAGIVASLVGTVLSVLVLVYLYGRSNLREQLHRYMPTGGLQGGAWNQ